MSEKLKILVVDDNPDHVWLTEKVVRDNFPDCLTDSAKDGAEALSKLKQNDYSAVLLDYQLPDYTGLEILKQANSKDKVSSAFIMITSQGSEKIAVEAMKEGAYDYLVKDFSFASELPLALQRTMERYHTEKENQKLKEKLQQEKTALERANQRLKELDQLKSIFISNVSHEFRTPLTAIIAFSSLARKRLANQVNNTQEENLEIIERNANRLNRLVDNLMDVTRIEAGTFTFRPEIVDLSSLVKDAIASLEPESRNKNVSLIHCEPGNLPEVYVDPNRISQVLYNLIGNAIKFSPEGKKIRVQVSSSSSSGDFVDVLVIDQGIGIAAEDHTRIFDRFYQVEKHAHKGTKGVGLGLAISKEIVEMHGGNIWVKSESGKGSEFGFCVPLYQPSEVLHLNIRNAINKARDKNSSLSLAAMRLIYLDQVKTVEEQERRYKEIVKRVTQLVRTSDIVLPLKTQTGILIVLVFVDKQGLELVKDRMGKVLSQTDYSTDKEILRLEVKFIPSLEKYQDENRLFEEVDQTILNLEKKRSFEYEPEKSLSCGR